MTLTEEQVRAVFRALRVKESEEWAVEELEKRINTVGETRRRIQAGQDYLFRSSELEILLKLTNCDGRGEIEVVPTPVKEKTKPPKMKWKDRMFAIKRGLGAKNRPRKGSAKELAYRVLMKATEKDPITKEKLARIIHANFPHREYYDVLNSAGRMMSELKVEYAIHVSSRNLDKSQRNGRPRLFGYWIEGDGKIKTSEEK